MSLIEDMLVGTAVYWPPGSEQSSLGQDFDAYGRPLYADAVEISVRWVDKSVEFLGPDSRKEMSQAIVYTSIDVRTSGVLWQGTLATVSDLTDPKQNDDAWEIKRFDKTPDIDGEEFLRKAYL